MDSDGLAVFQPLGEVVYIEIFPDRLNASKRVATVRFSSRPENGFWQNGTIVINFPPPVEVPVTCLNPRRPELIRSPVTGLEFPVEMSVRLHRLDFGFLSDVSTMDIMRSIQYPADSPSIFTLSAKFKFKKLEITFPCSIPHPRSTEPGEALGASQSSRQHRYKAAIQFSLIAKIYCITTDDGSEELIIPLESPPAFHKYNPSMSSQVDDTKTRWGDHEAWQRVGTIRYESNMRDEVTSFRRPNQFIDIGRWTTYRLTMDAGNKDMWQNMKSALSDFNIQITKLSKNNFKIRPGAPSNLWNMIDAPTSSGMASDLELLHSVESVHLPFEIRYQLEAAISQGVFTEQSISLEFLMKLAKLVPNPGPDFGKDVETEPNELPHFTNAWRFINRRRFNKARNLLEYVTDDRKHIYDPMSVFGHSSALTHTPGLGYEHCAWVRKVIITPSTMYLGSPTLEVTNRVLRQYEGNIDLFLRVQFTDERTEGRLSADQDSEKNHHLFNRVFNTLRNGIRIGDRHYQFLAFGNSQFREHGAYFFAPTGAQSCDDIRNWMGNFDHIKVIAKYASRLGQCFSTTRSPKGMTVDHTHIPDIEHNEWCFTDGVGKIGTYLAKDIAGQLKMLKKHGSPSAFQFRMGGNKGILVTWDDTKWNEVQIRPSQNKFTSMARNIEIIRPSRFSVATLNRQTVAILSCLGVSDSVFMDLTKHQLSDYRLAMDDQDTALRLLGRFTDENGTTTTLGQMIRDGFMIVQEPFALTVLQLWRAWSMKLLREKARIVVEQGAFVFGCVDETKSLRGHTHAEDADLAKNKEMLPQIFLQVPKIDQPENYHVITGFFNISAMLSCSPGQGDRDLPSMCSGGDLDGDDYFVFWDPRLIPKEWNHPPLHHDVIKPEELDRDVRIDDIIRFFVEYIKNDSLGAIAHAHVAMADRLPDGPKSEQCIELAKLHSNAVDYVKTGRKAHLNAKLRPKFWPHFMGKPERKSYRSNKVLGKLYDLIAAVDFTPKYDSAFDKRILRRYKLSDELLAKARRIKSQYDIAMRRVMNQREIATEFEIWSTFVMSKPRIGTEYKSQEDMGNAMLGLRDRFVTMCREEIGEKDQDQGTEMLYQFIAAAYQVTWEEVQVALQQCEQVQLIAGQMVPKRRRIPEQMPLLSFPWLFYYELGKIATGNGIDASEANDIEMPKIIRADVFKADGPPIIELDNGKVIHRGQELFVGALDTGDGGDGGNGNGEEEAEVAGGVKTEATSLLASSIGGDDEGGDQGDDDQEEIEDIEVEIEEDEGGGLQALERLGL
ncbi:rna-directed rna polymerase (sad-1) protein [Apiospora kogelbergensis]|uniref:RNA-dependent RNA polymerase n=1 Tax=Apiospora kogelbergensis TaxID=1337665 RepID=A0AAW0RCT6_9PEZI